MNNIKVSDFDILEFTLNSIKLIIVYICAAGQRQHAQGVTTKG